MFKTIWQITQEKPKEIKVDTSKPSLTEDCRVLSIPKLLKLSESVHLEFDGYDENVDALSDEELAKDDPRDDIADLFAEQQAINSLKGQIIANLNNDKKSAGDVTKQQSQADTTGDVVAPPKAE